MATNTLPEYSETKPIPVSFIVSSNNTRQQEDKPADIELAASMRQVGLISPIIVVKESEVRYRLVAGSRRTNGAIRNKWETIPGRIVLNPTEEVLKKIQIIENCQRSDIHPLDEGKAFLDLGKPEDIAMAIGKKIQYVYDRIHLTKLNERAAKLYYSGRISLSHALQICRLTSFDQNNVLDQILITSGRGDQKQIHGIGSVHRLKQIIATGSSVSLSLAKFNPLSPKFGTISCRSCEKRSGFNKRLFNDIEATDICFDGACFGLKNILYCESVEREVKAQGYQTKRLSGIYNGSLYAEAYNLESDFAYNVKQWDGSKLDDGTVIGIYFEHQVKAKVASTVILTAKGGVIDPQPEALPKEAIAEIRREKATRAFIAGMMHALAERAGQWHNEWIPLPIIMMICEDAFLEMSSSLQADVIKFYKWDFDISIVIEDNRKSFRNCTEALDSEGAIQLMLILLIYGALKNSLPGGPVYYYIDKLCREWRIDVLQICEKVEREFMIDINVIKTLFHQRER